MPYTRSRRREGTCFERRSNRNLHGPRTDPYSLRGKMTQTTQSPGELLTVDETAECLRISAKSVRNMISRGQLPGVVRLGRRVRVRRDDLRAWAKLPPI